jgi:hypothetical protein
MRVSIFDPLKARGLPLRALAKELTTALGEGYSTSTLQRIQSGSRVPTREILDGILLVTGTLIGRPLQREARQRLFALYYAALRVTDTDLCDFYLVLEERDAYAQRCAQLLSDVRCGDDGVIGFGAGQ